MDWEKLKLLGEEMTHCSIHCEGIRNEPNSGVIPRCLFPEIERNGGMGCAMVGINPGIADTSEKEFYLKKGISHKTALAYWEDELRDKNRYYLRLRNFANQIGLTGPILWTELVKCESYESGRLPPLQTFRVCTQRYLTNELTSIPKEWPLIAIGRKVYNALAYLYPDRTVIGIAHPTGSFGDFGELFEDGKLKDGKLKNMYTVDFEKEKGKAIWLNDRLYS